ncbi:MAG TPA: polysaccharide biosynthesis protein [Candidatus Coprenecus stercoravium]|uniref:Polysaccharide biosynthesis protein n=1 Tax=Candidatus Coprenecus stercoravium TaxID=2840735 RepID=A0A9D2GQP2_9BACT|nr:polysaccharide biosynthesis protein [Candidatus Coprenecus stercoravium]
MKNVRIRKMSAYLAGHYANRYYVLLIDVLISVGASLLVFALFDYFSKIRTDSIWYWNIALMSAGVSLLVSLLTKSYAGVLRHTTIREMWRVSFASILKGGLMFLILYLYVSRNDAIIFGGEWILLFVVVDMILTMFLLIIVRILLTNIYALITGTECRFMMNAFIYGVGDDSVNTLNFLDKTLQSRYRCVGFITSDRKNGNKLLCGYRVYHFRNEAEFARLAAICNVSVVIFPSNIAARNERDGIVRYCAEKNVKVMVRPPLLALSDNMFHNTIREIKVEDLLYRDEIKINILEIKQYLTDKVVLVTGGAGSIGGELCRQLVDMPIRKLILVDIAETPMHNMQLDLRSRAPRVDKKFIIADVRNQERMDYVFKKYSPDVVFHAAAYKHVPMMESNPCEAVTVNVFGTKNMVDISIRHGVDKFVMISTDKAVNPTSVMGASKRIAEIYAQTMGREIASGRISAKTKFVTTRFGNVLGSNGSVIPLFKKQIESGGPVTVTDPRVVRYFMTIPEACSLVLEAANMSNGNDIFIFDMGDPVKIDDLAKRMISLAGLQLGKDIQIKYVGLRPGEKLYEELLKDEENTLPTVHSKIFRAKVREYNISDVYQGLESLRTSASSQDKEATVAAMKRMVPEYKSANSRYEKIDN